MYACQMYYIYIYMYVCMYVCIYILLFVYIRMNFSFCPLLLLNFFYPPSNSLTNHDHNPFEPAPYT